MKKAVFSFIALLALVGSDSIEAAVSVQFKQTQIDGYESGRGVYVPIVLTGLPDSGLPFAVRAHVSGGTATVGEDFSFESGTGLVAYAWNTDSGFYIQLRDDLVHEQTETIEITLDPVNVIVGAANKVTIFLRNHDPDVYLQLSNFNQTEGESGVFYIYRGGDTNIPFSVECQALDGSARAGIDYHLTSTGRVDFAAGEIRKAFIFTFPLDGVVDDIEYRTFFLQLTNSTANVPILGPTEEVIAIHDRERPANLDGAYSPPPLNWGRNVVLPDGRIVGMFGGYGGPGARSRLVRIDVDGSFDPTFRPDSFLELSQGVSTIIASTNGSVFLAGHFRPLGDDGWLNIIRLLENGRIDPGFTLPATLNGTEIWPIQGLNNGGLLVRQFSNNVARLVRLMPSGAQDTSFDFNTTAEISSVLELSDGRLIVTANGYFTQEGVEYGQMVRLLANGQLDTTFRPGVYGELRGVIQHSNLGLILYGPPFHVEGLQNGYAQMLRLKNDGSLDPTFQPMAENGSSLVEAVVPAPLNKLIVLARWTDHPTVRLNSDGTLDRILPRIPAPDRQPVTWQGQSLLVPNTIGYGRFGPMHLLYRKYILDAIPTSMIEIEGNAPLGGLWWQTEWTKRFVSEGQNFAEFKVRRLGNTLEDAYCVIWTFPETALEDRDFRPFYTDIFFQPLEMEKTVVVRLLNNQLQEPEPRSFLVSAEMGGAISSQRVWIVDDEPSLRIERSPYSDQGIVLNLTAPQSSTWTIEFSSDLKTWSEFDQFYGSIYGEDRFYDSLDPAGFFRLKQLTQ
jgi:hypothetical protein